MTALYTIVLATRSLAWTTSRQWLIQRGPTTTTSIGLFSKTLITRSKTSYHRPSLRSSSNDEGSSEPYFLPGEKIQVEVISFGPLGASVEVIGKGHADEDLIPESEPALGKGLILQKEIHFFRQSRGDVDVVRGEVLPAYVERVRDTGKIDIALRTFGGKAKAEQMAEQILERLELASGGTLPIGDKSSPEAIGQEFPGVSKGTFKKAVAVLYKQGKVLPSPDSITLTR
jgi:hypothetical protein